MVNLTHIQMDNLIIPPAIYKAIIDHTEHTLPEEGCGLLSGVGRLVQYHFPITNIRHEKTHFFMDGKEMLLAFEWMEANGQELLAIYHSHPRGPDHPSMTDLAEDHYPDVAKIIVSKQISQWVLKGFIINNAKYVEIPLITSPTKG